MRKLFGTIIFILFSAVLAFSQGDLPATQSADGHGHDDNKEPIQIGWAVVTPAAVTTNGIVVFETFGYTRKTDTTQAGLLPPDLTTNAVLFVNYSGRLSKNVGVAIVNPNSTAVNVTLTLRYEDGTQLATTTINVPSHHQTSKFITELFPDHHSVPSDLTGTLVITSPSPVAVVGLRFRGDNFSTLPLTSLSGSGGALPTFGTGVGGTGALLLPQFAAYGGWGSEIVVANPGAAGLKVRVDLFKPDGTPLTAKLNGKTASSFTDLTVPGNGVLVLAPRNDHGDDDF